MRRYKLFLILLAAVLALYLFAQNSLRVEQWYSNGFYPPLARMMRLLTGWALFSFGDVLYFFAALCLVYAFIKTVQKIRHGLLKKLWRQWLLQVVQALLSLYIVFQVLWGLNYSRAGIAHQLAFNTKTYSDTSLIVLAQYVHSQLNHYAAQPAANAHFSDAELFQKSIQAFKNGTDKFPFLKYQNPSVKPSLFSRVGHYFGFTGYYNPFSGEAQVKTNMPPFIKPFVALHEMAHQLGYAKEAEASFVAYLASTQSGDAGVQYSVYFALYQYAEGELMRRDTAAGMGFRKSLHHKVLQDEKTWDAYLESTRNQIEPYVTSFYDQYLKWNKQQSGMRSYNEVVGLLMAYQNKISGK